MSFLSSLYEKVADSKVYTYMYVKFYDTFRVVDGLTINFYMYIHKIGYNYVYIAFAYIIGT